MTVVDRNDLTTRGENLPVFQWYCKAFSLHNNCFSFKVSTVFTGFELPNWIGYRIKLPAHKRFVMLSSNVSCLCSELKADHRAFETCPCEDKEPVTRPRLRSCFGCGWVYVEYPGQVFLPFLSLPDTFLVHNDVCWTKSSTTLCSRVKPLFCVFLLSHCDGYRLALTRNCLNNQLYVLTFTFLQF